MSRSGIVIGRIQSARDRAGAFGRPRDPGMPNEAVGAFGRPRRPPFVGAFGRPRDPGMPGGEVGAFGRPRDPGMPWEIGAVAPDEVIIPGQASASSTPVTEVQINALRAAATIKVVGTTLGAGAGYFLGSKKHASWKNVAAGAALGNIVSGFGMPILGTALFAGVGAGVAYLAGKKPLAGALAGAGTSAALSTLASVIVIGAAPTVVQRVAGLDHVAGLSVGGFGFPKEFPRTRWERDNAKKKAAAKKKAGGSRRDEDGDEPVDSDDLDV